MSNALDTSEKIGNRSKPDMPLAKAAALRHLSFQLWLKIRGKAGRETSCRADLGARAKVELLTDSDLPPRFHQTFPFIRIGRDLAGQENLHTPAEKIVRLGILTAHGLGTTPAPNPVQPRREDTRVVQYQQIVRPQQVRKLAETAVLPTSRLPIQACPVQVQQPRPSAIPQRLLGDRFGRKIVVEL